MPTVTYVLHDNTERRVEVPEGTSVMEGATQNDVRGIDAECGGFLSCATCHVYVAEDWFPRLPKPEDIELDFLVGVAAAQKPTSRLSCQIKMTPDLDGLVVRMPPTQS